MCSTNGGCADDGVVAVAVSVTGAGTGAIEIGAGVGAIEIGVGAIEIGAGVGAEVPAILYHLLESLL